MGSRPQRLPSNYKRYSNTHQQRSYCIGEGAHRVVAVRFINAGQVAVVTLPAETDHKGYSLFYFGFSEDGNSLVDLENMDWVLYRVQRKRANAQNHPLLAS
jgi:hypothetical protein